MKSIRTASLTAILSTTLMICALHFPHSAPAAPVAVQEVNVSLDTALENFPDGLMFVTAVLPENAPLPAEVDVMVPVGREILWAGEVLGGALANNPRVQYRRIPHNDSFETVRAVLTQSRTLQLEIEAGGKVVPQAGFTEALVEWQAPTALPLVRLGIVVPPGSTMTTGPANVLAGPAGDNKIVYYREYRDVAAGDTFELRVGYAPAANIDGAPGVPGAPQEHRGILFPIAVGVILAVITIALLVIKADTRRKRELQ